jgi:alanine racemase
MRPTWVEVRLDNLLHNINVVRGYVGAVKLLFVVKANAYGHGAVQIAKKATDAGIDWLGVASLDEAEEIRKSKISVPILVLGATPCEYAGEIIELGVTPTVFEEELATALSEEAKKRGKVCKVHIKIDTGMGRLGVVWSDAMGLVKRVCELPAIEVEGIFSHLSTAGEDDQYLKMQLARFKEILGLLEKDRIRIPMRHIANSAAMMGYPETWFDMVRVGIAIYGLYPVKGFRERIRLFPVMSLKSKIVQIKEWPKGARISYGATYQTERFTRIATIPVGYADGYSRVLGNRAYVLIREKRAPVVGRVCMDFIMADVTGISGVDIGDEVVLFGVQGREEITAEEIAELSGTINYEVVSKISSRIPRRYKE